MKIGKYSLGYCLVYPRPLRKGFYIVSERLNIRIWTMLILFAIRTSKSSTTKDLFDNVYYVLSFDFAFLGLCFSWSLRVTPKKHKPIEELSYYGGKDEWEFAFPKSAVSNIQ